MPIREIWGKSVRTHNRLTAMVWCAGWIIPLAALGLATSIPFWQAIITDAQRNVAQQIDYEDGTLCLKFGFPISSAKYENCKLDLLNLRRSHEELLAANSLP
jgi:hypothetical protein